MADKKISQLTSSGAIGGTEELPIVQSGSTVKTTINAIKTFFEAAGTYLTSANITQTITSGVTDKAPSEDKMFDALTPLRSPFHTTIPIDHAPNTTAVNAIFSQMIPAGTLKGGDILRVQFKMYRLSGTGSAFTNIYNGTSAGLIGNRIAQGSSNTSGAATNLVRNFRITPNGLSMSFVSGAIAFGSDETVVSNNTNEIQDYPFNVNVDQYFRVAIQMSVATDVYRLYYVYSQIIRP
jgi:hypothetical protein